MNRRLLPWILLLCLNGAAWLYFARARTGARAPAPVAKRAGVATGLATVVNTVVRTNQFGWAQLESEDYRTYIERLRAVGCPEQTIRDIVIADLEKLMAPRVREIEGVREPPRYWEPSHKDLTSALENVEKLGRKQEVDFEKREIVRELLGVDLAAERSRRRGESDFYEDRLSFLPQEKQTRVRMLMEKANQEEMVLREKSWLENDRLSAEERAELRAIQARKEDGIAALLSAEEQERFDLWFSPAAYRVRDAFLALAPNETDFLALYGIEREFDRNWGTVEPASLTPEEKAEYAQARLELEGKLREQLGAERFEKYQHAHDPDFRELQSTAVQFGLPPEVTGEIYDYRGALLDERRKVRDNSAMSGPQRAAILQALSEETERAVVEALGPKAYKYYVRQGAGRWIWDGAD